MSLKLYDNAWRSSYEEIKTWYPVWYREVAEMDALWRAWGRHLDDIQAGIIQAVDNNSIDYADAQTIGTLEKFLGIVYDGPRTLAERRNVLKAFVLGAGHIGQREIKDLLAVFADGIIEVALAGGAIQISVTRDLGDRFNLYDCHLVLDRRIPAHLDLRFVDNLLPVGLGNDFRFVFRRFDAHFAAGHSGRAAYRGLGVKIRFANHGTRKVYLDGREILDGSWLLGGAPCDIFAGLALRGLAASAHRFQNTNQARSGHGHSAAARNAETLHRSGVEFKGIRSRQSYSLRGSIKKSDWWALDGGVPLDGSRRLNSKVIEEDI